MAGGGGYYIGTRAGGVGAMVILDIDPTDAQFITVSPSDHKQDALPIFQGFDGVTWAFECVTDALVDQFTPLVGAEVTIKTRDPHKYNFGNYYAILDDFQTRSLIKGRCLEGRVRFILVESV